MQGADGPLQVFNAEAQRRGGAQRRMSEMSWFAWDAEGSPYGDGQQQLRPMVFRMGHHHCV